MMGMEPRERVVASLNHEEPDRVPRDLGSSLVTGIHRGAYKKYLDYTGEKLDGKIETRDLIQQLADVEGRHLERWAVDTRGVFSNPPSNWELAIEETETHHEFIDQWGIKWSKPKKSGLYYDITESPLAGDIEVEDIEKHDWPDPVDPARFKGLRDEINKINQGRRYFIFFTGLGPGIYEMCQWIRGHREFWLDLIRSPELSKTLLNKITELKLKFWERALTEIGDLIDTVYMADDLATQENLQISIDTYRNFIKEPHYRVFHYIKENAPTPIHIFYHSDGAVRELIPDLIEAGIDVLNPVQVSARGMNPSELKEEFGDKLSFWGAGGNPHGALVNETSEKVEEEISSRIEALAEGGGWVFAPIHNIQPDVPPENFEAMWNALDGYGSYD